MKGILSAAAAFCAAASFGVEGERAVFAHYMACFTPDKLTARKEMSVARLYSIDGWTLNCGEWQRREADGKWSDTRYVEAADNIFETAKGSDFKIFFSPDGGADGMDFYRAICENWRDALHSYGKLLFEVGIGQADAVLRLMRASGFGDVQILPDLNNIPRVVYGTLWDEI